jgi:hypothetical protein
MKIFQQSETDQENLKITKSGRAHFCSKKNQASTVAGLMDDWIVASFVA